MNLADAKEMSKEFKGKTVASIVEHKDGLYIVILFTNGTKLFVDRIAGWDLQAKYK